MTEILVNLWTFLLQYISILWIVLVLAAALGLVLRHLLYERKIASNGRITVTARYHWPAWHPWSDRRQVTQYKPYSSQQRLWLARVYSVQTLLFGLASFTIGLTLLAYGLLQLIASEYASVELLSVATLLAGSACVLTGILAIYWRHRSNPFN